MTLGQSLESGTQAFVEHHLDGVAGVILLRRAHTISRQRQKCRSARQGLLPVLTLALQHLTTEPAPLPHCVVGVLQRQRRQWIWLTVAERLIKRHQFTGQNPHRPAIGDDVVQGQQQHMMIVGQPHQASANQRIVL
ncbi:hypothetical protein D3C81_1726520 [compost metagenome]